MSYYFNLRPIFFISIALISGIIISSILPQTKYLIVFFSFCTIICLIRIIFQSKNKINYIQILFLCIGYFLFQAQYLKYQNPSYIKNFINDKNWKITGIIIKNNNKNFYKSQMIIKVLKLQSDDQSHNVFGNIRLTTYGEEDFKIGTKILFKSKLKSFRNFGNPGAFDYSRYMSLNLIEAYCYANIKAIKILSYNENPSTINKWIDIMQTAASEIIDNYSSQSTSGLIKAIIIGQKNKLSDDLLKAFQSIGAAHILAVSGLHIGIVASISYFLFRIIAARFSIVLWSGITELCAWILTSIPILIYGFLTGLSFSTQRAMIMIFVFIGSIFVKREKEPLNTLGIAAILIILIDPNSVFSISFQLSFTGVFFIISGIRRISSISNNNSMIDKTKYYLKMYILVTCFAVAGTLPLSLYYFYNVSFGSFISNILILPLIGYVIIPLGLISIFFGIISVDIASLFMKLCSYFTQILQDIVFFYSKYNFFELNGMRPDLFEVFILYSLLFVIVYIRKKYAKYALIIVIFLIIGDSVYWIKTRLLHNDLRITVIDVGQGNSTIVEFPFGDCMLIDGGGFSGSRFDVGERVVAPLLWKKKIRTIETIVLSHPHSDHLNGLLYIAEHFNVKEIWSNKQKVKSKKFKDFEKIIKEQNIIMPSIDKLKFVQNNSTSIEVLYPFSDITEHTSKSINNNSIVVKICIQDHCILIPGDIELEAENELLTNYYNKLKSDVLICPHHGSKTSSTEKFIQAVNGKFVIISAGFSNNLGLPNKNVLERYKNNKYKIFRTDLNGAVFIKTNGKELEVKPFNYY